MVADVQLFRSGTNFISIGGRGDFAFGKSAVSNVVPVASSVSISGTETVGETLTASYSYSDADGDLEGTSTYQWYRADDGVGTNEAAISGATSSTYTLVSADEGKYLRVGVVPVAATGASPGVEAFSAYTGAIAAATLTEIASVSASSSVSSLSTGAITTDSDKLYLFVLSSDHQAAETQTQVHVNSDTTSANYRRGFLHSDNSAGTDSAEVRSNTTTGGVVLMTGTFTVANGIVKIMGHGVGDAGSNRSYVSSVYNDSEGNVTSIQITADIEAGTYLKVYEWQ